MAIQHPFLEPSSSSVESSRPQSSVPPFGAWTLRLVRELSVTDWIVTAYLTILTVAVAGAVEAPTKGLCLTRALSLLAFDLAGLVLVRGGIIRDRFFAPVLHRFAVYGTLQLSYFHLRELLPLVSPHSLDAQLSHVDEKVLHFEPSLWMDQFVTPRTTEWFAFFYFSYFFLLAAHVLPLAFVSRRSKLFAEFALGMIIVYATAHTVYMLVPGYGPVRFLADRFTHALPSGFWLDTVLNAVNSGGAQKDIFPSLHTGGPVFLALFSFRHRKEKPFRYTWPVVAFIAGNIVIATMFLRWHYLIDVLAGLTLATTGFLVSGFVAPREVERRKAAGMSPVWSTILRPPL